MPSRQLYLTAVTLLALTLILGAMVSISLPTFSAMDFVRVTFPRAPKSDDVTKEFRFGIWAPCYYLGSGKRECVVGGHGYSVIIGSLTDARFVVLKAAWTRGLAIHPVVMVFTLISLIGSLVTWSHGHLFSLVVAALGSFLALIAFLVDIALYAHLKGMVGTFANTPGTHLGPAFWLSVIMLLALLVATGAIFMGGRREEASGSDYPAFSSGKGGIFARFRKQ